MKLRSGTRHHGQQAPEEQPGTHADTPPGGTALVVGHDGHSAGDRALTTAVDLADKLGAHLHIAHSVTLEDYGVDPDTDAFEEARDRNVAAERERIATALADTSVTWTYHEERGEPAACLGRLAHNVDAAFIVVGASHHGLFRHTMSGAVSKHLLHDQDRPVLIVPEPRPSQ